MKNMSRSINTKCRKKSKACKSTQLNRNDYRSANEENNNGPQDNDKILREIYKAQQINGEWNNHKLVYGLIPNFNDKEFKAKIMTALKNLNIEFKGSIETIWVTLLMILVLIVKFPEQKDEWKLLI